MKRDKEIKEGRKGKEYNAEERVKKAEEKAKQLKKLQETLKHAVKRMAMTQPTTEPYCLVYAGPLNETTSY